MEISKVKTTFYHIFNTLSSSQCPFCGLMVSNNIKCEHIIDIKNDGDEHIFTFRKRESIKCGS